jgi:hypothetical protein
MVRTNLPAHDAVMGGENASHRVVVQTPKLLAENASGLMWQFLQCGLPAFDWQTIVIVWRQDGRAPS